MLAPTSKPTVTQRRGIQSSNATPSNMGQTNMSPSKMSSRRSVFSWSEKEPWQVEFENEAVNDERWDCIVTGLIETKVEDEECLRIFTQSIAHGHIPLIRSIKMSDLIAKLKNESRHEGLKKNTDRKTTGKIKEKQRDQRKDTSSVSNSPSRFPEVLALISKHAQSSEEPYNMPPNIMAYAVKYMILEMKNEDCNFRRVNAVLRRKTRESKLREQMIRKLNGFPEERVAPESDEGGYDKMWWRQKFDILRGSPSKQGPLNGPDMYIVLSGFYNPLYFAELKNINVPFVAIIKIDNFRTISEKAFGSGGAKKQEGINYFWSELEDGVSRRSTTNLYKDIAMLKYTPAFNSEQSVEEKYAVVVNDLIATLYGAYHLNRLHRNYIRQMNVHRMIEILEPLDLSRCEMYNKLCDALVTEDSNCEIFILFSMIEQVVCGIPETETRTLDFIPESPESLTQANEFRPCSSFIKGKREEAVVTLDYLSESLRDRKKKSSGRQSKNPVIYFYDDLISLRTVNMDQNILKVEEIFNRFVTNSILSKISNKFPKLTSAEKTKSDFQFFRLWEKSKETEENFKVKLFFSIVMRLIEHTQVFERASEDVISSTASLNGSSGESRKSKSRSNLTLAPEEPVARETVFQEVASLFYTKTTSPETVKKKESSTKATVELKKVAAFSEIAPSESTSLENLEVGCGRCQKVEVTIDENQKGERDNSTYLGQLLESYEITYLNEPNLLVNRKEFEAFVARHNFYEILEPNRSVQRLQQVCDNYNSTEYTYFSPTDTLFVLAHNDSDFRGVHHSQKRGVIITPLSLRDFFTFVIPENRKWMENEDAEYIRFLESVKKRFVEEEQRRDHEFKCKFLKRYYAMTESERKILLEEKPMEKEPGTKKMSLSDKQSAEELTLDGLEDLPIKARQSQPKKLRFNGLNYGEVRVQVNSVGNQFYSDDGSVVGIRTLSWLYGASLNTLTIHRMGSELYLHKWMDGDTKKESLHFKDTSGILVTFDVDRSFPLFSKITWPNGLIIEYLPAKGMTYFYVKQTYLEKYRTEETIATESSRCFLPNGQVLVFRVNRIIDIMCSNGTRHRCQLLERKKKPPHCSKKTEGEGETEESEVRVMETITPSGEVWVADESSKCMHLARTMISLTGFDPGTKETFYRREDGTNCMLWPDGKLVINYPDGTKITSKPKFEEEEIFVYGDAEENKFSEGAGSKSGINFVDDTPNHGKRDGFVVVTCSYLMENPMYSSVLFKGPKLEMRMLQKAKIVITQAGTYKIESRHSVLRASPESVEFYNVCNRCSKKSISTLYLNSSDQDVMCKTVDYYDKKFIVYGSGKILYKTKTEDLISPEYEEEGLQEASIMAANQGTGCCEHHKLCKPLQRCLVLERDLTGMEFINERSLYRYIGGLSEDTYYDLCRTSVDEVPLRHAFFEPVYKTCRERYVMKYEENDSYPTRLTRKQLAGTGSHSAHVTVNPQNVNLKRKEKPKVIIARFVTVIHPDPVTVMQIIARAISLYQKRSNEVTEAYCKRLKERKQFPFASYVSKELNLIASNLCKSLDLYPHTCTTTPRTEIDIHSVGHKFCLNSYFEDVSPDDLRLKILPRCKQILKPFRHEGIDVDIREQENDQNP